MYNNNMDKKQLHKIIQDLIEVVGESKLKISDDVLFEQSCTYHRGEIMSRQHQLPTVGRTEDSIESGKPTHNSSADKYSPSEKQLKILREAGIREDIIKSMSKKEVGVVIGEYLNNLKRKNI
jgi:hypothetical protein